jgi:hypothetical protein
MRLDARARARRTHVVFPILSCKMLFQPHKNERERKRKKKDENDMTK